MVVAVMCRLEWPIPDWIIAAETSIKRNHVSPNTTSAHIAHCELLWKIEAHTSPWCDARMTNTKFQCDGCRKGILLKLTENMGIREWSSIWSFRCESDSYRNRINHTKFDGNLPSSQINNWCDDCRAEHAMTVISEWFRKNCWLSRVNHATLKIVDGKKMRREATNDPNGHRGKNHSSKQLT